jgi:hypothetical protein
MTQSPPASSPSGPRSSSSASGSGRSSDFSTINSLDEARAMTPVRSDFDPVSGKLIPPKSPPPILTNPAALAPTGSPPGSLSPADGFRSMLTGLGLYGFLQAANHLLDFVGSSSYLFPRYGPEIAAVAVALAHLASAWMRDNTPRPADTATHRVP